MAGWTDDELRRTAEAYFAMLGDARSGRPYSKTEVRRALIASDLPARTEQAIEYRMRNISAVLDELGDPTLPGYVPAKNVGRGVSAPIRDILTSLQLPPPITAGTAEAAALEQDDDAQPGAVPSRSPSGLSAVPPPMIYFNIGWMRNYAGPDPSDPTIGNHAYLGSHAHGAEAYNFAPEPGGLLYGYRPPGSRERVNIDRLGAARGDDYIDGVTVVWIARERSSGTSVIVGWYWNARVWRNAHPSNHVLNGERHAWSVQGQVADSVLVPVIARDFRVQSSRTAPGTGFGQKPTW